MGEELWRLAALLRCHLPLHHSVCAASPPAGAATKLWAELADRLLDPDRPGCFNQVGGE